MKSILYAIIAVMLFGILATSIPIKTNPKNQILIQATDMPVSLRTLNQSAEIITQRLKKFSEAPFEVNVIADRNQILIKYNNHLDQKMIKNLVSQKGQLTFHETLSSKAIQKLFSENINLSSHLQNKPPMDSSARIGCVSQNEMTQINDFLIAEHANSSWMWVWDDYFQKTEVCLYALKRTDDKLVTLSGSDIKYLNVRHNNEWKKDYLEISFSEDATTKWAEITQHNINQPIAIVIDNKLIVAPVVRSQIKGGNCQISGEFTKQQLQFIAAIGNNGVLPLSFKFIK